MRKIMFLLCTGEYSGAENITLIIASGLAARGYDVVYCSPDGGIKDYIRENYPTLRHLCLPKFSLKCIREQFMKERPNFVHAVDFKVSVFCAILRIPFVAHLHNNPPWLSRRGFRSLSLLFALRRAKSVICVSDGVLNQYAYQNRVSDRLTIVENVLDAHRVIAMSQQQNSKKFDILFIGRLCYQKNPLEFINIIKRLTEKGYSVHTAMIGADGGLGDACSEAINKNQVPVTILGFRENPYCIIANCKFVIMPSRFEGFGLTALESLILGKPVLASPVGGLGDVVSDEYGKKCHSTDEFVAWSEQLLSNGSLYQTLSANTSIAVKRYTDVSAYLDRIESVYSAIYDGQ